MGCFMTHVTARRILVSWAVADFVVGPTLVGAWFLGAVCWIFGAAAIVRFGAPIPLVAVPVGLAWAAIVLLVRRAVRWEIRLAR